MVDQPPRSDDIAPTPAAESTEIVDHPGVHADAPGSIPREDRKSVYGRERAEYGGIKFGVAFFGWLTATGLTAILGAVAAAIIASLGLSATSKSVDLAPAVASAIVLLVILFVAYLAGGYVAGRMARFAGAKQGVAVWIWGVVITGILAVVAAVAGSRLDVLSTAGIVPAIGFDSDHILGTVLTIAGAIVVSLLAAILGGVAGMRFHRRVDRAGWGR